MLKTVHASIDKVLELLHSRSDKRPYNRYQLISKANVGDLIEFLEPFKRASDALESCDITLPWVLPRMHSLLNKCKVDLIDSSMIQAVKRRFKREINRKLQFSISKIHYAATILHPSFKKAKFITDEQRETGEDFIKLVMQNFKTAALEPVATESVSEFDDFLPDVGSTDVDDLTAYLLDEPPRKKPEDVDIGEYWQDAVRRGRWHALTKAARSILAVPACSASCERVHSCAGRNMTDQRGRLDDESLSAVLFLNFHSKDKV